MRSRKPCAAPEHRSCFATSDACKDRLLRRLCAEWDLVGQDPGQNFIPGRTNARILSLDLAALRVRNLAASHCRNRIRLVLLTPSFSSTVRPSITPNAKVINSRRSVGRSTE